MLSGVGKQAGAWHGWLNWTNVLAHSIAEKAVPVERDERIRNVKYLLVGTKKVAAAAGINQ